MGSTLESYLQCLIHGLQAIQATINGLGVTFHGVSLTLGLLVSIKLLTDLMIMILYDGENFDDDTVDSVDSYYDDYSDFL